MTNFQFQHLEAGSENDFVEHSVETLEKKINEAINQNGSCAIGLSGGSTPRKVYEELGKRDIDWSKVIVFLVDDRYVPADHEESNQRLVQETLFKNADVGNVIFPNTELPIEECVADYEKRLPDKVDIAVMGMGGDGHMASLFPGDIKALTEEKRRVLHTTTDVFAVRDRITVTMPVLRSAGSVVFLLKGEDKKKKFAEVVSANVDIIEYPVQGVLGAGNTVWIIL